MSRSSLDDFVKRVGMRRLAEDPSLKGTLLQYKKRYEKDILQPNDPRFKKVYGDPDKKFAEDQKKAVEEARRKART